jgi:hypothetical protein
MGLTHSIAVCSVRFWYALLRVYEIVPFLWIAETVTQESLYELTDIVHGQVHPLLEHIEHWNLPAFSVISQSREKRGFQQRQLGWADD